MNIFGRLRGAAGRFNRWFGSTAVATDVANTGTVTPQITALGVRVVADEIEREVERDVESADTLSDEGAEAGGEADAGPR